MRSLCLALIFSMLAISPWTIGCGGSDTAAPTESVGSPDSEPVSTGAEQLDPDAV